MGVMRYYQEHELDEHEMALWDRRSQAPWRFFCRFPLVGALLGLAFGITLLLVNGRQPHLDPLVSLVAASIAGAIFGAFGGAVFVPMGMGKYREALAAREGS